MSKKHPCCQTYLAVYMLIPRFRVWRANGGAWRRAKKLPDGAVCSQNKCLLKEHYSNKSFSLKSFWSDDFHKWSAYRRWWWSWWCVSWASAGCAPIIGNTRAMHDWQLHYAAPIFGSFIGSGTGSGQIQLVYYWFFAVPFISRSRLYHLTAFIGQANTA